MSRAPASMLSQSQRTIDRPLTSLGLSSAISVLPSARFDLRPADHPPPPAATVARALRHVLDMHIHVLGFGAIGTLVSHYLRASLDPKHTITAIHRTSASAREASRLPGLKLEVAGVTRLQHGILHESQDPGADAALREALAIRKVRRFARRARLRALQEDPKAAQETDSAKTRHTEEDHGLALPRRDEPPHAAQSPWHDARHKAGPIESLIVATKANEAANAIWALLPRLSADSTIVLLHNGMGVYEYLVENVFRNREHRPHIVLSSTTHGAFVKEAGHVVHTGIGSIQLGIAPDPLGRNFEESVDSSLPREERRTNLNDITPLQNDPAATRYLSLRNTISALTSTTALDVTWDPLFDVQLAMQRKLAVNCIINPITALLGCRNGDIFKSPAGTHLAQTLSYEVSNVFRSQWRTEVWGLPPVDPRAAAPGDDTKDLDEADEDSYEDERTEAEAEEYMLETPFPARLTQRQLLDECMRVAELTRQNTSSMLVDIRRGRPTEINYLNGYILKLAKKYLVYTPVTAALVDLVHLRQDVPIDKPVPLQSVL